MNALPEIKQPLIAPGLLFANDQSYRVCDAETFEVEAQKLVEQLAAARIAGDIQAFSTVHIQVIAANEQRRLDLLKLVQDKANPTTKISASGEIFPFNFHSYRFRGRACLFILVDSQIAEAYFNGFDRSVVTNHQLTLNLTLSTVCHVMNKAYSELYFIV